MDLGDPGVLGGSLREAEEGTGAQRGVWTGMGTRMEQEGWEEPSKGHVEECGGRGGVVFSSADAGRDPAQ